MNITPEIEKMQEQYCNPDGCEECPVIKIYGLTACQYAQQLEENQDW